MAATGAMTNSNHAGSSVLPATDHATTTNGAASASSMATSTSDMRNHRAAARPRMPVTGAASAGQNGQIAVRKNAAAATTAAGAVSAVSQGRSVSRCGATRSEGTRNARSHTHHASGRRTPEAAGGGAGAAGPAVILNSGRVWRRAPGGMVTLLRDHAAVTGQAPYAAHGHATA
ncbi:MAG: hypothetical protein NTY65_10815 [Planctomycetota bacterium]|nr:hypothetical protein [Planctomycetota bacterium]